MQYNFTINNDKIVCDERGTPFTGNVNTYRCVFDITTTLANLVWFCVFEREGKAYVQPIVENECFIPHEVLISEGAIKIGCFATNLKEDDYKRISTNWVYFNSLEGAYTEASVPEIPEPDVWETLVLKSVPIIGENGNWYIYDIGTNSYVDTGVYADVDKKLSDSIVAAKNDISDAKENAISDIDAEKEKSTDTIIQGKDDSLKAISDAQNEVIKVIEAAENNALSDIDTEKGEAVQTITQEKEKALSGITSEKENATGAIEKEKQDVQGAVWDVRVEAIKTVETVKEEAVSDIDAEKEKAIKEVQEQSANLATKDEVANVLKETATGEIVQLDVSPIPHTVTVNVKSKNLISYPYALSSQESNGVTFTVNDDQTITVNGTPTVNTSFAIARGNMLSVEKGKTYTLSYNNVFTGNEYFYLSVASNGATVQSIQINQSKTATFTAEHDGYVNLGLVVYANKFYNNVSVKIQLEEGNTATAITPFIDPKTAILTRCKKNLVPYPYYRKTQTAQGLTWTVNDNGTISVTGTATAAAPYFECIGLSQPILLKAGTYIFSGCPAGGDSVGGKTGYYLTFGYRENRTDTRQTFVEIGKGVTRTFTTDVYVDCMPCIKKDTLVTNLVFEPMIRVASITDKKFELYDSETFEPSEDCTYKVASVSPIMTLLTDKTGAKIEAEYNQDVCAFKENVTNTIAQLTQAIIELGGTV